MREARSSNLRPGRIFTSRPAIGMIDNLLPTSPGGRLEGIDAVHEEAIRKADVLIEALGYIRKFHGRFTVIKLGGSVMEDPESLRALLVDVVFMQTVGMRPVVVHGGGKAITHAMEVAGLEPRLVQGRRYTDEATLDIVARVLAEEINPDIVRHINNSAAGPRGSTTRPTSASSATRCAARRRRRRDRPGPGRRGERGRRPADREPLPGRRRAVLPSLAEADDEGRCSTSTPTPPPPPWPGPPGREARLPDRHPRHPAIGTTPPASSAA